MFFFSISTGYFLKIDSSQGRPGDIADVQTPMFPSSHGVCYVRFFYYMYGGQHIGPLRVCTPFNLSYIPIKRPHYNKCPPIWMPKMAILLVCFGIPGTFNKRPL